MAWTLFEAEFHWPMARCEAVDTRVAPPIDAVTVDFDDTSTQAEEPAGQVPASIKVKRPATAQAHVPATASISVASTGFSVMGGVEGNSPMEVASPGGGHTAIEQRPKIALVPALLGIDAPPDARKIVYVVDRSASMGPAGALERAAAALGESIAALPTEAQFQVVFYNRRPELLPTDQGICLWHASASEKAAAIDSLHRWRAEGGTDHLSAIRAALSLRPEVIYWLTDGADLTPAEIDSITRGNKWKVIINAVDMGPSSGTGCQPLQKVALANRGIFRQLSSTGD
jgi:hypothetical protein